MVARWKWLALLVVLLSVLFVAAGCGGKGKETTGSQAGKEKVELKFSHPFPQAGYQGQVYEYFAKAVAEESKGSIEVKIFPSGTIASDPQILDAVSSGNVDMGHFMVAYVSPTIKELAPLEIPGAYSGGKYLEVAKVLDPMVDEIMSKYNLKLLGSIPVGNMSFSVAKKVGKVVKSPEDMKGLTVRTPGKWGGEAIKLWGGQPVTVPLGELPSALERKTVDVAYTGWIINDAFKLYETAPYVTISELQEMYQGIMVNGSVWNKLSKEQQSALERAMSKTQEYAFKLLQERLKEFENKLKSSGATLYYPTAEENKSFKNVRDVLLEQVKPVAGQGAEKLIQTIKSM